MTEEFEDDELEDEEGDEDFDVIEVNMTDEEIDEAIASLMELKEHKQSVQFPVAADLDLLVNYHEGEDEILEEDEENKEFEVDESLDDEEEEEEDEEEELAGGI